MSLRDLAQREGLQPKNTPSVKSWLTDRPELVQEILEMRGEGYGWTPLALLLKKHHGFTGNAEQLRKSIQLL